MYMCMRMSVKHKTVSIISKITVIVSINLSYRNVWNCSIAKLVHARILICIHHLREVPYLIIVVIMYFVIS